MCREAGVCSWKFQEIKLLQWRREVGEVCGKSPMPDAQDSTGGGGAHGWLQGAKGATPVLV